MIQKVCKAKKSLLNIASTARITSFLPGSNQCGTSKGAGSVKKASIRPGVKQVQPHSSLD